MYNWSVQIHEVFTLHRNSAVKRCEIGKYESSLDFLNEFFTQIKQSSLIYMSCMKAELRCKLQENLHCVTD